MYQLKSRHLLTGEELSETEILQLLEAAELLRQERNHGMLRKELQGKCLVLLFDKPSFRTHLSFTLAMQELGGTVIESYSDNRKKETPEDTIGVLSGYCHAVMVRTHSHEILQAMTKKGSIPVINGLSDTHHPCQTLADLLTIQQHLGSLKNRTITYLGDGNNILHSLLLIAPKVGVNVHFACPTGCEPDNEILSQINGSGYVKSFPDACEAAKGADALYTDVWTSMGFEFDASREALFQPYQLNTKVFQQAQDHALIMHNLPMERGKEITDEMADHSHSVLFRQSENRLHVQKALLFYYLRGIMPQCLTDPLVSDSSYCNVS